MSDCQVATAAAVLGLACLAACLDRLLKREFEALAGAEVVDLVAAPPEPPAGFGWPAARTVSCPGNCSGRRPCAKCGGTGRVAWYPCSICSDPGCDGPGRKH